MTVHRPEPFNPLDKVQLARSVERALLEQSIIPMSQLEPFVGSGIYAIYYVHPRAPYAGADVIYGAPPYSKGPAPVSKAEEAMRRTLRGCCAPIYVGKADAPGSRKGLEVDTESRSLFNRLRKHIQSVEAATNLDVADFGCRYLVADELFTPMAERLMIHHYRPVWNVSLDGFGNHDPGKKRHEGLCPDWDTLHPGRPWATKMAPQPQGRVQELSTLVAEEFYRSCRRAASPRIRSSQADVRYLEQVEAGLWDEEVRDLADEELVEDAL